MRNIETQSVFVKYCVHQLVTLFNYRYVHALLTEEMDLQICTVDV
jgi:hypothetical protein